MIRVSIYHIIFGIFFWKMHDAPWLINCIIALANVHKWFIFGVFEIAFIELILDRIDVVGIDLVIIDFEVKWFIFSNFSKKDFEIK